MYIAGTSVSTFHESQFSRGGGTEGFNGRFFLLNVTVESIIWLCFDRFVSVDASIFNEEDGASYLVPSMRHCVSQ